MTTLWISFKWNRPTFISESALPRAFRQKLLRQFFMYLTLRKCNNDCKILLLTEFEGRNGSYGPSFSPFDLWPKRLGHKSKPWTMSSAIIIKIVLVPEFCPLKPEIARFSIEFRLNIYSGIQQSEDYHDIPWIGQLSVVFVFVMIKTGEI